MSARSDLWAAWTTRQDRRAFETLVLPELPHALRFARRLGCDPSEAEDAVQEALARLASARHDPLATSGLRTWLCREVHTRARSRLRSERRRRQRQAAVATSIESTCADTAVDDRDEVARLLDALPADERTAVELRYLHDLDYREMALVLRLSEGACRQRVARALATLRQRVGQGAPALIAALPLPTARHGPALVRAALAKSSIAPLSAGGGTLLATTTSKLPVAVLALVAGIAATLGVQAAIDPPRDGARAPASDPARRLLAERDREIAGLKEQLAAVAGGTPEAPFSRKPDGAEADAKAGGYVQIGDRWRQAILQIADPAKSAAAWEETRAALRSDDPTTLCAGLWTVKFTSHCVDLDRAGLDAELVALLSGTAPLTRLLAWQALLQRDLCASNSGGTPVIDAALREQLRQQAAASPTIVRTSMLQALVDANAGDVVGSTAETVLEMLADEQRRGETIRGLTRARKLSPPLTRRLLDLANESPELARQVNHCVFDGLGDKDREIVVFLLDQAERGDFDVLKSLYRGVRAEDRSYAGERLRRLYDQHEAIGARSRIVVAIGHAGDLSSRDWLVRLAEDEHTDAGLRLAAQVAVRNLDKRDR